MPSFKTRINQLISSKRERQVATCSFKVMYTLTHEGENVGSSKLERGDPSAHAVSGVFHNVGGTKALAGWIKSIGGEEDEGVVFVELNSEFSLHDQAGKKLHLQVVT